MNVWECQSLPPMSSALNIRHRGSSLLWLYWHMAFCPFVQSSKSSSNFKNCFPVVCVWISSLNWLIPCLYEHKTRARGERGTTRGEQDQEICVGLNCYRNALYFAERSFKKRENPSPVSQHSIVYYRCTSKIGVNAQ